MIVLGLARRGFVGGGFVGQMRGRQFDVTGRRFIGFARFILGVRIDGRDRGGGFGDFGGALVVRCRIVGRQRRLG